MKQQSNLGMCLYKLRILQTTWRGTAYGIRKHGCVCMETPYIAEKHVTYNRILQTMCGMHFKQNDIWNTALVL